MNTQLLSIACWLCQSIFCASASQYLSTLVLRKGFCFNQLAAIGVMWTWPHTPDYCYLKPFYLKGTVGYRRVFEQMVKFYNNLGLLFEKMLVLNTGGGVPTIFLEDKGAWSGHTPVSLLAD